MKKKISILIGFLVITGLVSCSFPARSENPSSQEEVESQYQEVSALLTQTAMVAPVLSVTQISTDTPAPDEPAVYETMPSPGTAVPANTVLAAPTALTPAAGETDETQHLTPVASTTREAFPSEGAANNVPCDLAQLGFPGDLNLPDGTQLVPEQSFSKTWRLYNAGSCTWTAGYAIVWFSGYYMGGSQVQPLNAAVAPGSTIDVTVDLVAPQGPGAYQSNWKIQNETGDMFGIGPNGDAPFWLRIEVIDSGTPTVIPPTEEAIPVPIIYSSGSLSVLVGEAVDLDSAQANQGENNDLSIQSLAAETDAIQLVPLSSAHLAEFGTSVPLMFDCRETGEQNVPVVLSQDPLGIYYCYRTTQGLPGWITIKSIDYEKGLVDLEFVTWVVP